MGRTVRSRACHVPGSELQRRVPFLPLAPVGTANPLPAKGRMTGSHRALLPGWKLSGLGPNGRVWAGDLSARDKKSIKEAKGLLTE